MQSKFFRILLYLFAFMLFGVLSFLFTDIETTETSRVMTELKVQMPHSGVTHEVTAVLLNFRALDTLLEVVVILIALLAIYTLEPHFRYTPVSFESTITNTFVAILFPFIMLFAFYVLYSGSYQSGGAFAAAALLAGGIIILRLVKPRMFLEPKEVYLRLVFVSGLIYFSCVGVVTLFFGSFLSYTDSLASFFILSIESLLTLSLAAILSAYFIHSIEKGAS